MLHGTEAVVPLPNKKEIPVEIRGGTGNQNNINITVTVHDGTTQQNVQEIINKVQILDVLFLQLFKMSYNDKRDRVVY